MLHWQIIQLDRSTADCALCGKEVYEEYGLPMYEGRIDYRSKGIRTVCEECFIENNHPKGEQQ